MWLVGGFKYVVFIPRISFKWVGSTTKQLVVVAIIFFSTSYVAQLQLLALVRAALRLYTWMFPGVVSKT